MSIRFKVLGALALTFLVLFLALFLGARSVVLNSFEQLEQETTNLNVQRILNVLQDDLDNMLGTNADWGHWDATYQFVQDGDLAYVEENLSLEIMDSLQLNLMLFFNAAGQLVYAESADLEAGETVPVPDSFMAFVQPDSLLLQHLNEESTISGFVRTPEHLIMVSSRPVLTSQFTGPVVGTLVLARFVNESQIEALSASLETEISIFPYELAANEDSTLATALQDTAIVTRVQNEESILGYALLNDIMGQPIEIIQADIPREIFQRGLETLNILGSVLLIAALIIALVTALALEGVVISRVAKLSNEVDAIQEEGLQNRRVTVSSNDEVSNLSKNINTMLERIETNRKQLSEQNAALKIAYQQAEEATRLKSEFLSTMSHELRTPLNAIVGYAGIMLEGIGGEIDEDARDMIGNISEGSEHLLQLINDILDISKIEAGRMEIVNENFAVRPMIETVRNNLRVLAEQKTLEFDVDVDETVPMLLIGDKERISQILINLLSNAFKFTNKGAVGLYLTWQEDELRLRVRDTGIGIPPHALNYIFDEFRQVDGSSSRAYQGTGLGLAIVKKLAEAMGGTVGVESKVGEGSVFTVILPLKPTLQATT